MKILNILKKKIYYSPSSDNFFEGVIIAKFLFWNKIIYRTNKKCYVEWIYLTEFNSTERF